MSYWPLKLWKLRSLTTCHLQMGDSGNPVESKQFKPKGLRTRSTDVQRQEKMNIWAETERANSPFHYFGFHSGPQMASMMPTHTSESGFSLLILLIKMLISSGSTLIDIYQEIMFTSYLCTLSTIKLTHIVSRHNVRPFRSLAWVLTISQGT